MSVKAALASLLILLTPLFAKSSVVVQSTYVSPAGKQTTIRGTGALISFKHDFNKREKFNKLFVFTVAHLTGGKDLKIEIDGKPATIVGSALLSRQDIALYEVQLTSPAQAIAQWSFKDKQFTATFERKNGFVYDSQTQKTYKTFEIGIDQSATMNDVSSSAGALTQPLRPTPFIALPQNYNNGKARAYDRETNGILARNIRVTPMGRLIFEASIAPGMSGAPIFKFLRNEVNGSATYNLLGYTTQYSRSLNYSFGITNNVAYELMRAYLVKNARGEQLEKFKDRQVKSRWLHSGSTTYREIYDAKTHQVIAQESAALGNAGDEVFGEAGEGSNGDGGEGSNGDGGEGSNGDGGEGSNGDGGSEPKVCPSKNLKTGIIMNGAQVKYLKFSDAKGRYAIVQANLSALDFIFRHGNKLKVEVLEIPDEQKHQYYSSRSLLFKPSGEANSGLHITRRDTFEPNQFQTSHYNSKDGAIFDTFVYDIASSGISGDMRWSNEKSIKTKGAAVWSDSFLTFSSKMGRINYRMPLADLYSINLDNVDYTEVDERKPFESLVRIYSSPRFFFFEAAKGCK